MFMFLCVVSYYDNDDVTSPQFDNGTAYNDLGSSIAWEDETTYTFSIQ